LELKPSAEGLGHGHWPSKKVENLRLSVRHKRSCSFLALAIRRVASSDFRLFFFSFLASVSWYGAQYGLISSSNRLDVGFSSALNWVKDEYCGYSNTFRSPSK